MTAKYDLEINKYSDFNFWVQYLTDGNTAIDLTNYSAEMQIKKFRGADFPLLFVDLAGVTHGYTGGFTTGVAGDGSIQLNINYDKTALTGGILISFDAASTENLPYGKYFYDVKLLNGSLGTTYTQRLLEGRVLINEGVVE